MRHLVSIILLVLLNIGMAQATPRTFNVSLICMRGDCEEAEEAGRLAFRILESQLPVKFRYAMIREILPRRIDYLPDVIHAASVYFQPKLRDDGADIGLLVAPPSPVLELHGVLGVSFLGFLGRTPLVSMAHFWKNRIKTADVIAHEMGHALGADHDNHGLMTSSMAHPRHSRKISKRNLMQIKNHLLQVAKIKLP